MSPLHFRGRRSLALSQPITGTLCCGWMPSGLAYRKQVTADAQSITETPCVGVWSSENATWRTADVLPVLSPFPFPFPFVDRRFLYLWPFLQWKCTNDATSSADSSSVSAAYGSHSSATGNRSPVGWFSTAGVDEGIWNMADGCRVCGVDSVEEATAAVVARTSNEAPDRKTRYSLTIHTHKRLCVIHDPLLSPASQHGVYSALTTA